MDKLFSEIFDLQGERITLRRLTQNDADSLSELTRSERVYRFLPTFLFEKKYADTSLVISRLYTENIADSLILGVFADSCFCGLCELYGYKAEHQSVSIGARFLEKYWNMGIASELLDIVADYLSQNTDIKYLTAASMTENIFSGKALAKKGFELAEENVPDDWGTDRPVPTNKWCKLLKAPI